MKSIALKLWLGMMALVAFVMILLWLFQIVFLDSFYTGMRISEVKSQGYSAANSLGNEAQSDIDKKLELLANNSNTRVELIDLQGNILYTAGNTGINGQMPMMMNNAISEAFSEVLKGVEVSVSLIHPRFGSKFQLIGLPVKSSGRFQSILLITMPLAPVNDTAAILKKQLLYIIPVLLLAASILSFLISRLFTKPILKITAVSSLMASGDLSARIELHNKDEIGRLAGTINYMGQQLTKIDQLRKDLIANVSHELRTPLSLIRGYAETIRDISGNEPIKRDKQLKIIIEESERLSKIVDDMLGLSQMQAGFLTLDITKFQIHETLERIVKRYEVLSEKSGIEVSIEDNVEAYVKADEARIEQVLYNLINNSFNHTGQEGKITVRAYDLQDVVKIEVRDTGEGIPEKDIPHVWDRFYKADKTGNRSMAGTGLGLAIVKNILDAHNFQYGVESKVGDGTTFWVELRK